MDAKKPYVELLAATPEPLQVMWNVWHFAKDPPEQDLIDCGTRKEQVELFRRLMGEWTAIPEFISFAFLGYNINRALLAQLTRHRLFSFFARSQRVDDQSNFASEGNYFTPESCTEVDFVGNGEPADINARDILAGQNTIADVYRHHMDKSQQAYVKLLELGIPIEDARGVLPEHSLNNIAFSCNLRALAQAVTTRYCWMLQKSYWGPLLTSMKDALLSVDSELGYIFHPPCDRTGKCLSEMEMKRRLQGQDPNPPCPKYVARGTS